MREKLQTLPLTQLRELAKAQGLKGVTTLKKAEIICSKPPPSEKYKSTFLPCSTVTKRTWF